MSVRKLKSCRLNFLSEDEIQQVNQAILQVLWEVGVRVEWQPALEVYAQNGCKVDFSRQIVKISENVLHKALATAPSEFRLHAQDPDFDVHVTLEDVYTVAGSSALFALDLDHVRRPATLQDLIDFTRLIDALDQAHIMHAMVIPQDMPQPGFDRILFSKIMQNTRKHYYSQGQGKQSVIDQVDMATVLQGSLDQVRAAPVFSFVVCFNSPLFHTPERVQEMMELAKYNIPVWLEPTNMMGATAPITIAGALVEHTANALAGLTLMQMLNPGHPCILGVASGSFNMRYGTYVAASPEAVLLHCATAQMMHFYGLPFEGGSGVDSCTPDAQAGYERMLQAAPMALAGVNFIHLALGMMDQLITSSYELAVIDNEILTAAFRIGRGIEITPETLAVDQIRQVGIGGQFLDQDETLYNYRLHHWQPVLTTRLGWDEWQRRHGGKDMRQRANEMARKILEQHNPQPLSPEQIMELDRLAKLYQRRAVDDSKY
jgi:trimethylamine--corrinoid protein Co-methyltransferase